MWIRRALLTRSKRGRADASRSDHTPIRSAVRARRESRRGTEDAFSSFECNDAPDRAGCFIKCRRAELDLLIRLPTPANRSSLAEPRFNRGRRGCSVPCCRSPNCVRPLIVALYCSKSRRPDKRRHLGVRSARQALEKKSLRAISSAQATRPPQKIGTNNWLVAMSPLPDSVLCM